MSNSNLMPVPINVSVEPLQTQVEPPSPDIVVTDEQMIRAMQAQGFCNLSKNVLRDLAHIGIYTHAAGAVRIQQGRVMVTQQRLDGAMKVLYNELVKVNKSKVKDNRTERLTKLAQILGVLSSKQVEASKHMIQLEGGHSATEPGAPIDGLVKGFTPGAEVRPGHNVVFAREAHIHQTEAPATTK